MSLLLLQIAKEQYVKNRIMVLTEARVGGHKVLSIDSIVANWQQWVELLQRLGEVRRTKEARRTLFVKKKKGKRAFTKNDVKALEQLEAIIVNIRF